MLVVQKTKSFFEDVIKEAKMVQWPEKSQAIRLTIYVVGVSLVVGLIVSGFDYGFKELVKFILNQ